MVKVVGNQLVKYQPEEFYNSYYHHPSVPLFPGSPIWTSSPEPVPIDDCARYPNSPLCSGGFGGIGLLNLNTSIVNDACNIGIEANPYLFSNPLPSSRIVYRKPECRNPLPKRNEKIFRESSILPIKRVDMNYLGANINAGAWVEYCSYYELYEEYPGIQTEPFLYDGNKIGIPYVHAKFRLEVLDARFPYKLSSNALTIGLLLKIKTTFEIVHTGTVQEEIKDIYIDESDISKNINGGFNIQIDNRPYVGIQRYTRLEFGIGIYLTIYTRFSTLGSTSRPTPFVENIYTPTRRSFNQNVFDNGNVDPPFETTKRSIQVNKEIFFDSSNSIRNLVSDKYYYRVYESTLLYVKGSGLPQTSEIPYPQKDCCDMACCPNSDTEQMLKLILKRIGEPNTVEIFDEDLERKGSQAANKTPQSLNEYLKLATQRIEIANRIMGIANFPVEMPETMIRPHKEGVFAKIFGFIDEKKRRKINSVTELLAWMAEQDSAILGQFHQVFELDNLEGGRDTVVIPNIAEGISEILLLISQMARQTSATFEAEFRLASEIMATRVAATKAATIAADIQDFLDYPTNTKVEKVPTAFNIPKLRRNQKGDLIADQNSEDYRNVLKNGEVQFTYDDWTGDKSFHDQMLDLLQVAAMLRAILYQKSNT